MGRGHAATKASAEDRKKAACPQHKAGISKGDQSGGGVASPAAGATPMQLRDDDEEPEPGQIPPEKPAAGCNAFPAHGSLLSKEEEMAAAGSSRAYRAPAVVVSTGAVVARVDKAATEISATEVFVGELSRDATVADVRAALSAAGEITEVRMIRDRTTREKNKGYCFVAYRDAAMASKAVAEFANIKICGKPCRVAVPEGNQKTNKVAQRQPLISYVVPPLVAMPAGYYIPMYDNGKGTGVYLPAVPPPDLNHGLAGPSGRSQMGQSGSGRRAGQPHRRRK